MSQTPAAYPPDEDPGSRRTARIAMRVAVVLALLVVSGAVRSWQAGRVSTMLAVGRKSPFPLSTIPLTLGDWKGEATDLDPQIVRGTGSTDLITRHYVNSRTGVGIDLIVLYGPTSDMFIHSPEACYPKAGFQRTEGPVEHAVATPPGSKVPYRSGVYRKGEGGPSDMQEVYFTWWYDGHWSTSVSSPKASERIPGMYKIQVSRQVRPRERRDLDNPTESFLGDLTAEMEDRMAKSGLFAPPSAGPPQGAARLPGESLTR